MKCAKKYLSFLLVIAIAVCSVTTITAFAIKDNQGSTESEIQPMMAQSCSDDDDYSDYDGMTFKNTSQGLNAMGVPFSGSGLDIVLLSPMLDISFSQCGTDLCVFITYNSTGKQLSWFKVKQW